MIKNLLTIAGSDPSGGAGIQADLKSFAARGTYGMAVISALTAQNTRGVSAIHYPPLDFLEQQLTAIFDDITVDGMKIGMIGNAEVGRTIAKNLRRHSVENVILDPVMIAKGGARLLDNDAIDLLRDELIPLARVVTPNLPEAAALLQCDVAQDRSDMEEQASALLKLGANAIFLKGGHLSGNESPDLIATNSTILWLESRRHVTTNTHGTGCSLSSALAAELAKGNTLEAAAFSAKQWLEGAIIRSSDLSVGFGHGPVHHFYEQFNSMNPPAP